MSDVPVLDPDSAITRVGEHVMLWFRGQDYFECKYCGLKVKDFQEVSPECPGKSKSLPDH